jgi:hypothetical protein
MTMVAYHATKAKNPTEDDCKSLLKIVNHLRQTPDKGLILFPKSPDDGNKIYITAMVDAAYMSHDDAGSHTGYCISIGSKNPKSYFFSKSYKQKLTATSSTHAEVRALYDLTIQIIFLTSLFNELNRPIETPVIVFEDNQPCIDLVTQETTRLGKSKHYLNIINFIKEQVQLGLLKLSKIDTSKNISNVLTKIVCGKEFYDSFQAIMGHDNYHNNNL